MTRLQKGISDRIDLLIRDANRLGLKQKRLLEPHFFGQVEGVLTSIGHIVDLLRFEEGHPYRSALLEMHRELSGGDGFINPPVERVFSKARYLLDSISHDVRLGLVGDFESVIGGEIYDEILDHAEAYHASGHKFSGVIAGVAFEDTIKRLGNRHAIVSRKVDDIITELAKVNVFSAVKAKRARVAADVRTKATHAEWEAFGLKDVKACIDFTRELIDEYFS